MKIHGPLILALPDLSRLPYDSDGSFVGPVSAARYFQFAGSFQFTLAKSHCETVLRPTADELLNTITHGAGLLLSIVGSAFMLGCVFAQGDAWRCTGCSVYSLALVGVYASSTFSHSASQPDLKRLFRMLDQAFIYLLIVGTYTPFALAYLRSGWWLLFLGLMWTIALFGFLSKILIAHRVDAVAIWIYLMLGWMPIVAGIPLVGIVPALPLWWMLIGGLCYTVGTVFLMNDRRVPQFHAVWHLCVIAGSAFHFFAILHAVART